MTRVLPFTKMHGLGNDFMVLDGIRDELPPLEDLARRYSDRHFGVGFDQLLVVRRSEVADFRMEIYNADGSQVEMCANGIRAFFKFLRDAGHSRADEIRVETLGGIVVPRWAGGDRVTVDMGPPVLAPSRIPTRLSSGSEEGPLLDVPLSVDDRIVRVSCVSMGNPHAVVYVDDVEKAPVTELGPLIEHHEAFPNRVNVEFVKVLDDGGGVQQRTWERGAGETLACGSGACAVVVASVLRGVLDGEATVELPGGQLQIAWDGPGQSVFMTGPAATVYRGEIDLEGE